MQKTRIPCFITSVYCPLFIIFCSLFYGCGGANVEFSANIPSQSTPYVHRIDPANGKAGDAVTVFGFGFSVLAGENVVTFGSVSVVAEGYSVVSPSAEGEIESLTVTVPSGASLGDNAIFVTVLENTSNADISFTLTE